MQASLVGAAILASILHTQTIGLADLRDKLYMPSLPVPKARAVEIVAAVRSTSSSGVPSFTVRPFVEPTRIPTTTPVINDINDAAPDLNAVLSSSTGRPDGVIGSMLSEASARHVPPSPTRTEASVKPQTQAQTVAREPLKLGGVVLEAKIIRRVIPVYPPIARQARISGTVKLMSVISREGKVEKLQVLSGHPLLVPAALEAVKLWLYRPTLLNGEPTEVMAPIEVHFTLTQQ